ncbi:DUF1740-domain-containing protein, partial [Aureobasidium melanogenum]
MVSKVWLAATRGSKSNDLLCCARCALRSSWSVDFLAICANCCCKAVAMVPIDVAWVSPTVSSRASLTQWLATLRVVEFGRRQRCCLGFCLLLLVPSIFAKKFHFLPKTRCSWHTNPRGRPITNTLSKTHHHGNSDLFVVDLKGDQQNVAYDRLHKYSIPPYHRVGYGSILGLHTRFKIDRAESTLDKILVTDKSANSKQVPQRLLLKRQRNQELSSLHVHDEPELDLAQDFVSLSPSADDHDSKPMDESFDSFRNSDQIVDSEPHRVREHQIPDVASDVDLRVRQQNVQFVRATKSDPSNLQAWLDLANHQERLVSPGADAHSLTNVERQTLADMRIAVYEKALKHVNTSETAKRERLLLGLLQEAAVAWDAQKYMNKLQGILQQYPESFRIWSLCQENIRAQHSHAWFEGYFR